MFSHSFSLFLIKSSRSHKFTIKLPTFCKLQNQKDITLVIKILIKFDNVWMLKSFRDLYFITDLSHHVIIFYLFFRNFLQCVIFTILHECCLIHFTKCSMTLNKKSFTIYLKFSNCFIVNFYFILFYLL